MCRDVMHLRELGVDSARFLSFATHQPDAGLEFRSIRRNDPYDRSPRDLPTPLKIKRNGNTGCSKRNFLDV